MAQEFVRPNLTKNGTLGGDSPAVWGTGNNTTAYYAFDTTTTYCNLVSTSGPTIIYYQPRSVKLTNMVITNYANNFVLDNIQIYGSADNSIWHEITCSTVTNNAIQTVTLTNNNYYNYYKITGKQHTTNGWSPNDIAMSGIELIEPILSNYLWASPNEHKWCIRY